MNINLLINGTTRPAQTNKTFERVDPVTGKVCTVAAAASLDDINEAASSAHLAFQSWSKTGPSERRAILMKAADIMTDKADEFTQRMITETGATGGWAHFNVSLAAEVIREAAAMTTQPGGELIPANKPGTLAMAQYKAKGVCLAIAPWNAPVILATRAIAMPIACGNSAILKSSELCPATHSLIGECFLEAGLPAGVLSILSNAPEDAAELVNALIANPNIKHVNFTGSSAVGRIIGRTAGEHLKPALLELGGKAPLVILDDADIDQAVNAAIFGAFMNQGQICMSTERLIVLESIADDFVGKLAARASNLSVGDPRGDVQLGSLVSEQSAYNMSLIINDALSKGGKLVAGGESSGAIVQATLIDQVTDEMKIYQEESFGPVKPIIRVADELEAIRVANDTEYGLSAAVFSQDIQRAMRVADQIESGICHINGPTVGDEPQMPFGGVKASGFGRFGGKAAIGEFMDVRWITIEDPNQHYPI